MGLTQKLGTIPLAIQTDSSNNVGIGGAANASYKLAVTGASLFSSNILANGVMSLGDDGTYGATYKTLGLTGNTDGTHRILAGTSDDMYIAAATSRGIKFCVNGSITTRAIITSNGNIGIGTSSPSSLLTIAGTTDLAFIDSSNLLRIDRSSGVARMQNYNGGGVAHISLCWEGGNTLIGTTNNLGYKLLANGVVASNTAGADANYQPAFVAIYTGNSNETNAISTAVSSNGASSGFRFDVSNGAGSTNRTASLYVNRGAVSVVGSLSKGSGSFKIDHPIESMSDTHHLVHSFVESPQANNIYRGKVQLINGKAEVNLDEVSTMTEGTFILLNREIHTYTSNETDWDNVRGKVDGNILTIECQNNQSNAIVSWLVIGERQDKHMMDTEWTDDNGKVIVEPLKIKS